MSQSRTPKRPLKTELRHRINAGRVAVRHQISLFKRLFGKVSMEWKSDDTRVTFADYAISEKMIAELRTDFPEDDFCSEEGNADDEVQRLQAEFAWVLDPIDGTNNFYFGLPMCAISLGLLRHGQPVYGFVYDFSRDKLIEGGPGQPLLDGAKPCQPSTEPFTHQSLCAVHFPLEASQLRALVPLLERQRIRCLGSSALNLAWSAIGKLDGCVDFKVHVWDIAAAVALLMAGEGKITYLSENPFPLNTFRTNAAPIQFYAGSKPFCTYVHAHCGRLDGLRST